MKKRLFLVMLLSVTFLFTACGNNNKLVCFEELNDGEFKQSIIINYNKEKTKVESTNIEIIVNIEELDLKVYGCTKETKEECIEELEAKYNAGCENMLEECNIKDKTENGFIFTAKVKDDKLEEYYGEISTTLPINQMKSKIEIKFGMTCD